MSKDRNWCQQVGEMILMCFNSELHIQSFKIQYIFTQIGKSCTSLSKIDWYSKNIKRHWLHWMISLFLILDTSITVSHSIKLHETSAFHRWSNSSSQKAELSILWNSSIFFELDQPNKKLYLHESWTMILYFSLSEFSKFTT